MTCLHAQHACVCVARAYTPYPLHALNVCAKLATSGWFQAVPWTEKPRAVQGWGSWPGTATLLLESFTHGCTSCYCHHHAHPARGPPPWPAQPLVPGLALLRGHVVGSRLTLRPSMAQQMAVPFPLLSWGHDLRDGGMDSRERVTDVADPLPCPRHALRTWISFIGVPTGPSGDMGGKESGASKSGHWRTT